MLSIGTSAFPITRLKEPLYRFDPAREAAVSRRVDVGLRDHGPYDKGKWRGRKFRVLVVGLDENRRSVEETLKKFEHGVPTDQGVFTGFRKMYRLEQLEVVTTFAPKSNAKEMVRYEGAAQAALQASPDRAAGQSKFDLVLVVTQARFREMPTSENPYFQMKGLALILDGVPTQAIHVETLRNSDYNLQYILNTMSLACYAKMGGTSHVLDVQDADDGYTELVIGVGRAVVGDGRFGNDKEETIGFATVFRANGEYIYNDCTPYCDRDKYESALETTIIRTVNEVAASQGLSTGAKLHLIFHVPRRPGKHEERAVLNAVGKLPRFKVDFALVHVNDDHHFHAFDKANTEGTGRKRAKPEAALMTERGLCVALGPDERLVTFIGVDQYRGFGTPGPVLVRLDRRSTITDIDSIAQQLYWLSFMDVGSLNPGVSPATISYAEKLARLTGHLRGVQRWTVDIIHKKLGRRLWFV